MSYSDSENELYDNDEDSVGHVSMSRKAPRPRKIPCSPSNFQSSSNASKRVSDQRKDKMKRSRSGKDGPATKKSKKAQKTAEEIKQDEEKAKKKRERELKAQMKKNKELQDKLSLERSANMLSKFIKSSQKPINVNSSDKKSDHKGSLLLTPEKIPKFQPLPFYKKRDMELAPTLRRQELADDEKEALDNYVSSKPPLVVEDTNYVQDVKKCGGRKTGRTEFDDGRHIMLDATQVNYMPAGVKKWRFKLLQFDDEIRPPYWGSWMRPPVLVNARKYFAREDFVDYDENSDEEWEEDMKLEDAEGMDGDSDGAEDGSLNEDDEDLDSWVVPTGYLSDDEGTHGEHRDKELLRQKEDNIYSQLKKTSTQYYKTPTPEIQTEGLHEYKMWVHR